LDNQNLLHYRVHGGNTLREAAIIGREQDRDLIREYMLKIIPDNYKEYVAVGSDRLVELEKELNQVKSQIAQKSISKALRELKDALHNWIIRKVRS
jgi:hypothetical protein